MASDFIKNKHLANRAGFGISLSQVKRFERQSLEDTWKEYSKESGFSPISFDSPPVDFDYNTLSELNANQKKQVQQRNREQNMEINLNFLMAMVSSEDQLREKMAFFWHGHFATRVINSKFSQQILNEIRKNALGNFKDLLFAVSKSPAMLNFLNARQNKKGYPNENFAREVMELFTMGRDHYTEEDVREAARAFTGWSYDKEGRFIERKNLHDTGTKTFLGKTGNFDGDDILDIILEQQATAEFITSKIYRFLVNEEINENHVRELSEKFYQSDYDIGRLLDKIFTSGWFYDAENIGSKIKSPVELMVGIMRMLPMKIDKPENLIIYQKLLGQMLLYPPNVAGWPSGKAWIDSSTLLLRMQIPQIWSGLRPLDVAPNEDDDVDMGLREKQNLAKGFKNPDISIDWPGVETTLSGKNIYEILLQRYQSINESTLKKFSDGSIRMTIIDVMSTPEYQLC